VRAALQSKQVAVRCTLVAARLSSFPQYWHGRRMSLRTVITRSS
jgi:hypothetical protein